MDSNKVLAFAMGFCSFMWFKNLRLGSNRIINTISATTFGVFLIHANSDAMREWLWNHIINCAGHYGDTYMPLYVVGCIFAIFASCSLIDLFWIKCIETPLMNRYGIKIDKFFSKLGDGIWAEYNKIIGQKL